MKQKYGNEEPALIVKSLSKKKWIMTRLNKVNGVITSTHNTLKEAKTKATELGYEFEVGKHLWGNG